MTGWARIRESFWYVPALFCAVAVVLAEGLIALDRNLGEPALGPLSVLVNRIGAAGSRDVLGAIAGSVLTVAATSFSITIAVLATASSTYGPRLVRNFMADRGNQLVLGVFTATFLYSLLVLRSIRDPDGRDEVFVPHLAVTVAVLLAVLAIGVLVYFINHIADSVQVFTLARQVRTELLAAVDRLYPERLGRGPADVPDGAGAPDVPAGATVDGVVVAAREVGVPAGRRRGRAAGGGRRARPRRDAAGATGTARHRGRRAGTGLAAGPRRRRSRGAGPGLLRDRPGPQPLPGRRVRGAGTGGDGGAGAVAEHERPVHGDQRTRRPQRGSDTARRPGPAVALPVRRPGSAADRRAPGGPRRAAGPRLRRDADLRGGASRRAGPDPRSGPSARRHDRLRRRARTPRGHAERLVEAFDRTAPQRCDADDLRRRAAEVTRGLRA